MYLTAGTFNIILRQVSLLEMDEAEVFSVLGIDSSFFETKKQFINQRLVKNRNEIAHGRYLLIDIIDYYEIFKIIIELIKNFKDRIENAAITEAYKRIA